MAINNGKNELNEELPDEHEVIQHSLRDNPEKHQPDDQQRNPQPGSKQDDASHQNNQSVARKGTVKKQS